MKNDMEIKEVDIAELEGILMTDEEADRIIREHQSERPNVAPTSASSEMKEMLEDLSTQEYTEGTVSKTMPSQNDGKPYTK